MGREETDVEEEEDDDEDDDELLLLGTKAEEDGVLVFMCWARSNKAALTVSTLFWVFLFRAVEEKELPSRSTPRMV